MSCLHTSLPREEILSLVVRQVDHAIPDGRPVDLALLSRVLSGALDRLEYCFNEIEVDQYRREDKPWFDHLHTDHWAMFLFFLGNELHRENPHHRDCVKLFYLNKIYHGVDAFYDLQLPDIFLFVHPLGTILGHASYSDYFVVYQNVTVGSNLKSQFPVFEKEVALMAKSTVIGSSHIGENCQVGAGAMVVDSEVQANTNVFGLFPANLFKKNHRRVRDNHFRLL